MAKTIKQRAIRKGIKPSVVYTRMSKGMSEEDALNTPVRNYNKADTPKPYRGHKADRVREYIATHPTAKPKEIAVECDVSYSYAFKILYPLGAPKQMEFDFNARPAVTTSQSLPAPSSPQRSSHAAVHTASWVLTGLALAGLVAVVAVAAGQ